MKHIKCSYSHWYSHNLNTLPNNKSIPYKYHKTIHIHYDNLDIGKYLNYKVYNKDHNKAGMFQYQKCIQLYICHIFNNFICTSNNCYPNKMYTRVMKECIQNYLYKLCIIRHCNCSFDNLLPNREYMYWKSYQLLYLKGMYKYCWLEWNLKNIYCRYWSYRSYIQHHI